ncbi:MAG: hypothetical protein ABR526_11270 [Chthoniobacterales bacterium]
MAANVLAQAPDVRVELSGKRVVTTDGHESLAPADKAKPSDIIQYEATYKNVGKTPAANVAATVPIPVGLTLVDKSAKPAAEQASLDGKNFSPLPLMREVKNEAGVMEKQPVALAQYRALRWTLPELAPGKTATVVLRAQVLTNTTAQ